jgi:hypothetical protein
MTEFAELDRVIEFSASLISQQSTGFACKWVRGISRMKAFAFLFAMVVGVCAGVSGEVYRASVENAVRAEISSAIPEGSSRDEAISYLKANSFRFETFERPLSMDGVDYVWIAGSQEHRSVWGTFYVVVYFYIKKQDNSVAHVEVLSFFPGHASL